MKNITNNIKGGLSDKLSVADIAKKHNVPVSKIKDQIKMGVGVEMEHTDDPTLAAEIAKDHVTEEPEYYTKLKSIEGDSAAKSKKKILKKESVNVRYTQPNFEVEWEEAIRYPEFKKMGKRMWIDVANNGKTTTFSKIRNVLGNVDLDFEGLEQPKRERFKKAFDKGVIEIPIAVKFSDQDYDLVAGNTRLAGLVDNGVDPKIWVVDISKMKKLKELIRQEIRNQRSMNEATYVMHYGQGQNRFAHQLKAFSLNKALKQFIDMYKIPKEKWRNIIVRKASMF